MILGIRTDKPEAQLLLLQDNGVLVEEYRWTAHKQLAETLHKEISGLLDRNNHSQKDVTRVIVYAGPGSFTGLRIGISVANALAYGLGVPIVGSSGEQWLEECIELQNIDHKVILPFYGQDPHITQAKK